MIELSSKDVWRAVLGELELQVPKPSFETWLKQTEGLSHDESHFVVGVQTPFALEWLERRMYQSIHRTVERVVRRPMEVQFRVSSAGLSDYNDPARIGQAGGGPAGDNPSGGDSDYQARPFQPDAGRGDRFNPRYTFASFVVGPSNRLAYCAANAVADSPGQGYNPLFLYSGVGLGKTHLLHAIGRRCAENGRTALYVTSEQFTNDFITAIRNRTTEEFRSRYRQVETLLMDDVQFLSGKEQTHEGFFHTFNDLHTSGRQVVITSDRPPNELALLPDRMRSRFEWGLIADIEPPGLETRMAILSLKAEQLRVKLPEDIIELMAKRVQNNVRELEGSLNRIVAYAQLMNVPITYESVAKILDSIASQPNRETIDPATIIAQVAAHFQIEPQTLVGRSRLKKISLARQVAMYLLIYELEMSPTEVGRVLGNRDHSTVIHGAGKVNGEIHEDAPVKQDVLAIKESIFK